MGPSSRVVLCSTILAIIGGTVRYSRIVLRVFRLPDAAAVSGAFFDEHGACSTGTACCSSGPGAALAAADGEDGDGAVAVGASLLPRRSQQRSSSGRSRGSGRRSSGLVSAAFGSLLGAGPGRNLDVGCREKQKARGPASASSELRPLFYGGTED